jgi:hypothetical protein
MFSFKKVFVLELEIGANKNKRDKNCKKSGMCDRKTNDLQSFYLKISSDKLCRVEKLIYKTKISETVQERFLFIS